MYFIDSAKMIKKQNVLTKDLKFLAVRINLILNGHVFVIANTNKIHTCYGRNSNSDRS